MFEKAHRIIQTVGVVIIALAAMRVSASGAELAGEGRDKAAGLATSTGSPDGQSKTALPDVRLLLLGGIVSGIPVKTAIVEDPKTGKQVDTAAEMQYARAFHSATLLPNGKVLILGGFGENGKITDQAELFDPVTSSFQRLSFNDLIPRAHHTATLLTDGRILIAGGIGYQGEVLGETELLDYRTGTVSTLASNVRALRAGHTAILLADGAVLLWGGHDENGGALKYGEIIDPSAPSSYFESRLPILDNAEPSLAASIPQSGETGILLKQIVALRFSEPLDVTSLNTSTITMRTPTENLRISVVPAESGMLAFVTPQEPLNYGTTYTLQISGATNEAGQKFRDTTVLFTTVVQAAVGSPEGIASATGSGSSEATGEPSSVASAKASNSQWRSLRPLAAERGVTALAGQILTLDGSPLPNVLVEIDSKHAYTDSTGRFLVRNTGAGHHIMIVGSAPASTKSKTYGIYRVGVDLKEGLTNSLNYTFWMTALDMQHVVTIPSPTTSDVVITNPDIPGLELHVPAGTVIHDARGKIVTQIGITPIPTNQPPFPLKRGVQFPTYFTIQPGGATFTNGGATWSPSETNKAKGARIFYKNYLNGKAGARYAFWNYDPAQKGWYVYGHGRVSGNGKTIEPEAGTQIWSFDGAMVSQPYNAPPISPIPNNPADAEPVDLQTGLFVYHKTDLVLNDVIPVILQRTYRQGDTVSRSFGIGTNMDYDMFMVGDDIYTPQGYTYQDLILADGGRVHFTRISPCLGTNGYCDYANATYAATSTTTDFYGATLAWVTSDVGDYGSWTLTKKDGTVYYFPDSTDSTNPRQAAPTGMIDRHGNALTFTRDSKSNLTRIASPNGRWMQFTYDSVNRVVQAQDNAGRSTSYTYNDAGYLATATNANGGVTTYTYDSDGNMVSIQDPRGIVYLQNQYDSNDRVNLQTLADGGTYQFSYSTDSNGNVVQTNVTDQRGHVRQVVFNSDGHMTSDTHALGRPEQQTVTYSRQPGTGLLLSMTDALGRVTSYSYDAMANLASVTQLAGTSNVVTTTIGYDPRYYQVSAVTDPLGNSTAMAYDSNGNLLSTSDPLGESTIFTYNAAGQPLTATDALGNQTQFGYDAGDLVSVTDPLGRTVSQFVDAAGRIASTTDPLGHTTILAHDGLDNVTNTTDALGNQTTLSYDGNGNLLTVTDANQHVTNYTYDAMDRVWKRTDALGNAETSIYDLSGNLSQFTDRKGQATTYAYDALNRLAGITFNDGSTIANTYDAGNRVTGVTDSLSGTISRSYDGLDHPLTETTAQGSITYTYRGDGRRQTMTVAGQPQVGYSFDNAGRLTSITEGSASVSFGYDSAGRRTSLTLPNGITANYGYDAGSQLTSIVYQKSGLAPADLEYGYDLAGRRVSVTGGLASTQLPAAMSNAVYNANNQLTQWGTTVMTYDTNGNTLSDGMNSYAWDTRNRLVSANNNGAVFSYDPLGRRTGKTILSANTNFLYDGANPVQELNGSTVTANLLTGGVDERFMRATATETDNYLTDALGSTVVLTDPTGNSTVQYSYAPYGGINISGTTTNSFTYTGREIDGLGINYYRARYYNPTTGRFLSEDPLGFAGGDVNLYAYAGDDPIDAIDPTGWATYVTNRLIAGSTAVPGWEAVSHTFTFSTNPDGSIAATYSWGNTANPVGWNLDQAEDMKAAAQALANGDAQMVGGDYMDPFYRQAYDQLNNPANNHGNGWVHNNCKTEANNLRQRATQLWNASPLGQALAQMQALAQYYANSGLGPNTLMGMH
ncbi:MAG: kelch repeat-containing protein [Formivibrio sp.]|nr:kelch repeat-containing protein [Formivibrio sp.]